MQTYAASERARRLLSDAASAIKRRNRSTYRRPVKGLAALAVELAHRGYELVACQREGFCRRLLVDQLFVRGLFSDLLEPGVVVGDELMTVPPLPVGRSELVDPAAVAHRAEYLTGVGAATWEHSPRAIGVSFLIHGCGIGGGHLMRVMDYLR
jgi:hypothetical protein